MAGPYLIANCPRCSAKRITFDVLGRVYTGHGHASWQIAFEVPAECRECNRVTIWRAILNNYDMLRAVGAENYWTTANKLSDAFAITDFVSQKDASSEGPPEHVPEDVAEIFREASLCKAVGCPNASAAMSRLCLDLVTKSLLPEQGNLETAQPNRDQRKKLFDRLDWLFETKKLPDDLKPLADAIRHQGNGGAHDGTCQLIDADDLIDFTVNLLERVYTMPERTRLARQRSIDRRAGQ